MLIAMACLHEDAMLGASLCKEISALGALDRVCLLCASTTRPALKTCSLASTSGVLCNAKLPVLRLFGKNSDVPHLLARLFFFDSKLSLAEVIMWLHFWMCFNSMQMGDEASIFKLDQYFL